MTTTCTPEKPEAPQARCSAADLLRWSGMPALEGDETDAMLDRHTFPVRWLEAGQPLVLEGTPLASLYLVRSGTFKVFQTERDGYEQVHAFALQGDMLGLDGLHDERHETGAVALEPSSVVVLALKDWQRAMREAPALARLQARAASLELARRGATLHNMAAVAAEVRLARFLLQLSARLASPEQPCSRIHLRMSRREIASLLGVSHESVSRSLGLLSTEGLIRVKHRDVDLVDEPGLIARQSTTRPERDLAAS